LERVNRRPFQKLDASRHDLFLELDKPALKALPAKRYEYAEYRLARVNIDYHVEVLGHYYSVPYQLRGQQVEVRLTARTVEVLRKGKRVASHARDDRKGYHTTEAAHMPKAHRAHLEWTPSRLIQWAGTIGPYCAEATRHIIESRPHPEQGYRACLGLLRLSKRYETDRVEAACHRAVALGVCTYQSIKSILASGKDREPLPTPQTRPARCARPHENVRGRAYYGESGVAGTCARP
jgi:transposase